jgi:hypothetical protein
VEIEGLDLPEMGALAYPDFSLVPSHSGGMLPQGASAASITASELVGAKKPQTA